MLVPEITIEDILSIIPDYDIEIWVNEVIHQLEEEQPAIFQYLLRVHKEYGSRASFVGMMVLKSIENALLRETVNGT